jgi:hypothetical protein
MGNGGQDRRTPFVQAIGGMRGARIVSRVVRPRPGLCACLSEAHLRCRFGCLAACRRLALALVGLALCAPRLLLLLQQLLEAPPLLGQVAAHVTLHAVGALKALCNADSQTDK